MKTRYFAVALAVVALTLAPGFNPCEAGSVTYGFTEGSGAPNPGTIGATITFLSPPAQASSGWSTNASTDVSGLLITDSALFPDNFTGTFPLEPISRTIESSTGQTIDQGELDSAVDHRFIQISPESTEFGIPAAQNVVQGSWTVLTSVPEPATAVQAGIAIAIGVGLAAFRKLKEARRQRPVGPLDASQ